MPQVAVVSDSKQIEPVCSPTGNPDLPAKFTPSAAQEIVVALAGGVPVTVVTGPLVVDVGVASSEKEIESIGTP